jgi:hypothetical protein
MVRGIHWMRRAESRNPRPESLWGYRQAASVPSLAKEWSSRRVSRVSRVFSCRSLCSYGPKPVSGRHGAPADEARAGVDRQEWERNGSAAGGHPNFLRGQAASPVLSEVSPRKVVRTLCRAIWKAVQNAAECVGAASVFAAQRRFHSTGRPRKRGASGMRVGGASVRTAGVGAGRILRPAGVRSVVCRGWVVGSQEDAGPAEKRGWPPAAPHLCANPGPRLPRGQMRRLIRRCKGDAANGDQSMRTFTTTLRTAWRAPAMQPGLCASSG